MGIAGATGPDEAGTKRQATVITGLDHVQVAIPAGGEERARAFYAGVLRMAEVTKPPALAVRGGCWFTSGTATLHLGVERDFRPAHKAHPAFVVTDLDELEASLRALHVECTESEEIPGVRRFHCTDPFGNRLEFQQA